MQITPYLSFNGECQEAIDLYKRAFNTEASQVVRVSDIPQSPDNSMPISDDQMNWILQATLKLGSNSIRLSDCFGALNDTPTERIAIVVECSIDEVKHAFSVLSEEGTVGKALHQTFFSSCHGVVHDKFGVMWNFVGMTENQ